jgi:hypothetical protein
MTVVVVVVVMMMKHNDCPDINEELIQILMA